MPYAGRPWLGIRLSILAVIAGQGLVSISTVSAVAIVPKDPGAWFGASFEVHSESIQSYFDRVGIAPAIINLFVPLPLGQNGTEYLQLVVPQATRVKVAIMLTVTPFEGFDAVTEASVQELAFYISQFEQVGRLPKLA